VPVSAATSSRASRPTPSRTNCAARRTAGRDAAGRGASQRFHPAVPLARTPARKPGQIRPDPGQTGRRARPEHAQRHPGARTGTRSNSPHHRRSRTGKITAVLYCNNPFGTVRSRRAERHFLSRWLSSGECASKFSSPELWCLVTPEMTTVFRGAPPTRSGWNRDVCDDNTQGAR
jgi:hypothetical protein